MHAGKDWVPAPFLLFRYHLRWVTVFLVYCLGGKFIIIFVLMVISCMHYCAMRPTIA